MSTHFTSGAPARSAQIAADWHSQAAPTGPTPSNGLPKCAVESCSASVSAGGQDCCNIHGAEDEVVELADFVRAQIERSDGNIDEAVCAARTLLDRLLALSTSRNAVPANLGPVPC